MGAAARRSWDEKLRAHHGGVFIRRRCLPLFRHAGLRADGCSAHVQLHGDRLDGREQAAICAEPNPGYRGPDSTDRDVPQPRHDAAFLHSRRRERHNQDQHGTREPGTECDVELHGRVDDSHRVQRDPVPTGTRRGRRHRVLLYPAPRDGHGRQHRLGGCSDRWYAPGKGDPLASLLDRDHRHRGHAPLDDHQLLLDQVLESTLQGPARTRPKRIAMTEIIRTDAPRRSAIASLALGGLVVGVVWFSILSVIIALQVLSGCEDGQADTYMAGFLGMVFLLLTAALDIYRKEFMPDELIHKIRRPKIVLTRAFR